MTNIFNGVPHYHQASGVYPNDPTITYFFYYDGTINKVYKHDSTSNTTTIHDIGSGANQLFPNLPTTHAMMRATYSSNGNMYVKWEDPSSGVNYQRQYPNATTGPYGPVTTASTDIHNAATANTSFAIGISPTILQVRLPNNGWATDHQYNQGSWGGTTAYYTGLPQTQHRSINMIPSNNNQVLVFYDTGIVYTIDLSTQQVVSSAPYGATIPVVNLFNGVPIDTQAFSIFDYTYYIFYKDYKYYIHNYATNTTSAGVAFGAGTSVMTQIPTGQTINMGYVDPPNNWIYINVGTNWYRYSYTLNNGVPSFTFVAIISNASWFTGGMPTSGWDGLAPYSIGDKMWLFNGSSYVQYTYGGSGQPFDGLPHDIGCVDIRIDDTLKGWAFKGTKYYEISLTYSGIGGGTALIGRRPSGGTLVSSGTLPSAPPPTPLTDIEVIYQAPAQFNLFSNNVALVTETQYGWNFTKTILNADKMELYLYHSSAAGAIPFNYDQLRDIKINMKNNLVLPAGEIFITIWTGPAVAPNWYNYKDIYNLTPALGTTLDVDLVETILTLSDIRTDPILAIALHSNSSQQQVNCDVERVSFEVLLPANNNSQRVIVKLQNNFVVVDDKYWDLESNPIARLGTQILPTFEIFTINPNIIAGNYPQSATAKEPPSGCAYYLNGTWSEWTQTSANVWAPSGNTLTFTSGTVNPGIDTNGAAYVGTIGGFSFSPNWASSPFTWTITTSNQVKITLNNGTPITFSPLADLPQPQNTFTAAQFESGLFSSSDVGTLTTSVLISNSVSSFKSPVFPREIDLTFLSESQVIIRRSWEIVDTTYTITSSNVLSGQYVSPTYPVSSTPLVPDTYTMPTEWVVLANNDSQFFIEFSGGLNNTITADGAYNMTVNPVGPSPITYAWTANYYTSADVLISPVVGAGATGSVSNFNITLASVPASAEYILYVCTSSENVQAFASLVIIQSAAAIPFVLDFQNQSAQIVTDATYTVTPNPVDAGTTYAYTATYNNEFDASLGNVLGAVASGPASSFNFVYANMPTGTKYINYTCNATGGSQGGEVARLSISIIPQIPPAPQTFELEFNGGVAPVNITADGTYDVVPYPTESSTIITYTYTANYFNGTTDLGAVVGFDVTGQSSSFQFTFAGMPAGATYIKYVCSASGTGLQNGETAESIIGLVSPNPGNEDVALIRSTSGNIEYQQYNPTASLKLLTGDRLPEIKMTLVDSYGKTLYTNKPIYYELEIRSSITKE